MKYVRSGWHPWQDAAALKQREAEQNARFPVVITPISITEAEVPMSDLPISFCTYHKIDHPVDEFSRSDKGGGRISAWCKIAQKIDAEDKKLARQVFAIDIAGMTRNGGKYAEIEFFASAVSVGLPPDSPFSADERSARPTNHKRCVACLKFKFARNVQGGKKSAFAATGSKRTPYTSIDGFRDICKDCVEKGQPDVTVKDPQGAFTFKFVPAKKAPAKKAASKSSPVPKAEAMSQLKDAAAELDLLPIREMFEDLVPAALMLALETRIKERDAKVFAAAQASAPSNQAELDAKDEKIKAMQDDIRAFTSLREGMADSYTQLQSYLP